MILVKLLSYISVKSRDSVVVTATGYGLEGRGVGVRVPLGVNIFSASSGPALGPIQPPIQWVLGVLSPGEKQLPELESEHSPPTSAEV
jgi:hypothetical protein